MPDVISSRLFLLAITLSIYGRGEVEVEFASYRVDFRNHATPKCFIESEEVLHYEFTQSTRSSFQAGTLTTPDDTGLIYSLKIHPRVVRGLNFTLNDNFEVQALRFVMGNKLERGMSCSDFGCTASLVVGMMHQCIKGQLNSDLCSTYSLSQQMNCDGESDTSHHAAPTSHRASVSSAYHAEASEHLFSFDFKSRSDAAFARRLRLLRRPLSLDLDLEVLL